MAYESAHIQDAKVDTAASGDTEIIAAQASKKIIVHSYALVSSAAVSAKWKSGTTDKSGALSFAANSGICCPGGLDSRWFATGLGEALVLNLSGPVQTSGHVSYSLEPR